MHDKKPSPLCFVNTDWVPLDQAVIPITDRGLRFGDGVFETMRVVDGQIRLLEYHQKRCAQGLAALQIELDVAKASALWVEAVIRNKLIDGGVRVIITRGSGSQGYLPLSSSQPTHIIEPMLQRPTPPAICRLWAGGAQTPSAASMPVHAKHLAHLSSVCARMEADAHGCDDAIMLDTQGHLAECSSASLYWVVDGVCYTPDPACDAVDGVVRRFLMEHAATSIVPAKAGLEVLRQAQEVFVSNALWGVVPVVEIAPMGWVYKPGEVSLYHTGIL